MSICFVATDHQHLEALSTICSAFDEATALHKFNVRILVDSSTREAVSQNIQHPAIEVITITNTLSDTLNITHQQSRIRCLLCMDESTQQQLISYKQRFDIPPYLVRFHIKAIEIAKTEANRKLHNENTDINAFIDFEVKQFYDHVYYGKRDSLQHLDNPCLLEQSHTDNACTVGRMLEHLILALLSPSRDHEVRGKRQSFSHIKLSYITHFYCNQNNIDSVVELFRRYERYDPQVLQQIHFVIVDDGSPVEYDIPDFNLNLSWLKIKQDIRWNQAGARNLGALNAKSTNMIISDLDHEFPESTLRALLSKPRVGNKLYKFRRKNLTDNSFYKGHPNIFLLSRGVFFEHFGLDEEFAGAYGAEDFRFVKYLKAQGINHYHLPRSLYCFEREDIDRDKSYHSLIRDLSFNTPIDARKKFEMQYFGHDNGHSRMNLNFDWELLKENWLTCNDTPPADTSWSKRWLLRQLKSLLCG